MWARVAATLLLLFSVGVCINGPALDQVQFKATHNSYNLPDAPNVQIDKYDVWEIELDFGIPFDSPDFIVGHDGPKPKHKLSSLGDWIRNALSAESLSVHPLIIKLEAKTTKPCSPFRFPSFQCGASWDRGWQARLRDSLRSWIGDTSWITPQKFRTELHGQWPSVRDLVGKVIITLQDSNNDRDIQSNNDYFFPREIPGITAVWPPITNEAGLVDAMRSGRNRLTMDDAYRRAWSIRRPLTLPDKSR
jgi:hypothetical protein